MISCEQYDYIEIACMHRYPVKVTLKSGEELDGTAVDTARNGDKQECLRLRSEDQDSLVVLDDLLKLSVLVDNPHFTQVEFPDNQR